MSSRLTKAKQLKDQTDLCTERGKVAQLKDGNTKMAKELADQDETIEKLATLDCRQCLNQEELVRKLHSATVLNGVLIGVILLIITGALLR